MSSGASVAEDAQGAGTGRSRGTRSASRDPCARRSCRLPPRRIRPPLKFRIVYLSKEYDEPPPLSYAEPIITDKGIQGARLSLKEANQSGAFVGRTFELEEAIVPEDGDVVAKAKEILKDGDALIVADLIAPDLLAVADLPEAKNSILMNVRVER